MVNKGEEYIKVSQGSSENSSGISRVLYDMKFNKFAQTSTIDTPTCPLKTCNFSSLLQFHQRSALHSQLHPKCLTSGYIILETNHKYIEVPCPDSA